MTSLAGWAGLNEVRFYSRQTRRTWAFVIAPVGVPHWRIVKLSSAFVDGPTDSLTNARSHRKPITVRLMSGTGPVSGRSGDLMRNSHPECCSLADLRFHSDCTPTQPHAFVDAAQSQSTSGALAGHEADAVVDDPEINGLRCPYQLDADRACTRVADSIGQRLLCDAEQA